MLSLDWTGQENIMDVPSLNYLRVFLNQSIRKEIIMVRQRHEGSNDVLDSVDIKGCIEEIFAWVSTAAGVDDTLGDRSLRSILVSTAKDVADIMIWFPWAVSIFGKSEGRPGSCNVILLSRNYYLLADVYIDKQLGRHHYLLCIEACRGCSSSLSLRF